MIKLPYIFASGAIFQADSQIVISGCAAECKSVKCELTDRIGNTVAHYTAESDECGKFSVKIETPSASFMEYSIRITCADDTEIIENIMFGEVWLAAGQSNMELQNFAIPKHGELFDEIKNKNIRVFHVDPGYTPSSDFPWDPAADGMGVWILPGDTERFLKVSAAGTKFASDIYDVLNRENEVPVAIINANTGGTPILSWVPRDSIDGEPTLLDRVKMLDRYPTHDKWNTLGEANYQQTCAQFNSKIAPLLGVKFRGIIWYQGEFDTYNEFGDRLYYDYLKLYKKTYTELFAADKSYFPMITSLLYRMNFGASGECRVALVDNAFIRAAADMPRDFIFSPIADLEPSWNFAGGNNMLHPTHKYRVGARLASIAAANVYGESGQKTAAHIESCEICGNKIVIHTFPSEYALKLGKNGCDTRAHGLYIAGDDGIYLPAECKITSPSTLEVWCEEISAPKHVAYAIQSLEPRCNIFAGDYPLAPYYSDKESDIRIEARPWYDTSVTSVWVLYDYDNAFFRPVWNPTDSSFVCHDTAFCYDSDASVRVEAKEGESEFGCYIQSYPYNGLDLQKFSALRLNLFNMKNATAEFVISYESGEVVRPIVKLSDIEAGWALYEAALADLPDGDIQSITFRFKDAESRFKFVNIEKPRLVI